MRRILELPYVEGECWR